MFDWKSFFGEDGPLNRFWKSVKRFVKGEDGNPDKELHDPFTRACVDVIEETFIPLIRKRLIERKHIYTHRTHDTLTAKVEGAGRVVIVADAPYFSRVEFGSGPRPVGAEERERLLDWVRVKHPRTPDPEAHAKAVIDTIQTKGNVEHAPFAFAYEEAKGHIPELVLKRLRWEFEK